MTKTKTVTRFIPAARFGTILIFSALLAGCGSTLSRIGIGNGGDQPATGATTETAQANPEGQIELRKYYGSGYCPVIEVRDGTQVLRRYERRAEPTEEALIWQVSIGDTARECQDDPGGTMTIRVGVSGRILAGPRGGPSDVKVPIRIAVVKYKEAVLKSELHNETVSIGPNLSSVFRRVYEIQVPSPGDERNYLIYVGFDEGK